MPRRQLLLHARRQAVLVGLVARAQLVELAQAAPGAAPPPAPRRAAAPARRPPPGAVPAVRRRARAPGFGHRKEADALAGDSRVRSPAAASPGGGRRLARASPGAKLRPRLRPRLCELARRSAPSSRPGALQQLLRQRRSEQRQLQPPERDEGQRQRQRVGQHAPGFAEARCWFAPSPGSTAANRGYRIRRRLGRWNRSMLGAELSLLVLNAVLLTLLVAPLVLWRYRRAVLAGMMARAADGAACRSRRGRRCRATAATAIRRSALRWEAPRAPARIRRGAGVSSSSARCRCRRCSSSSATCRDTPVHLYPKAGVLATLAVPMAAVLVALPFAARAAAVGCRRCWCWRPPACVLSMLQRPVLWPHAEPGPGAELRALPAAGRRSRCGCRWQLLLATGARRVRGVAPIVLAGLLVFGLAPLLGCG